MNETNSHLPSIPYRPDIDGLRAIAVLLVIIYHAFPDFLKGGFIGVDIFFVISGFLITSIIYKNLNSNNFSFLDFYSRRIRRLAPALIVVLTFTFCTGLFFLQGSEFALLKKHLIGGTTFTSNFMFWSESGYFDNSADSKPLLHLWSLAIEEQFYLIWPFLIFIFFKIKKFNIILLTSFIFVISLFSSIDFSYSYPVAAFFSLQSRFWEFLIGALLYFFQYKIYFLNTKPLVKNAHFKSLFGLVLIFFSVISLSSRSLFPGWWALLPTIGAALIISSDPNSYINKNFLSNKYIVYIGTISYPLYLWHWPILSLSRIILSEVPSISLRLSLLLITFLLSALTYHLIECRLRQLRNLNYITSYLLLILLLICLTAYSRLGHLPTPITDSTSSDKVQFENYYLPTEGFQTLERFEGKFRHECNFYQVEKFYIGQATVIPKNSIDKSCYELDEKNKHSILIWGDSHAQMLNYGLSKNLPSDWQILQVASSGCHPSIDFQYDSDTNYCARSNWFALKTIEMANVKVVVIAQSVDHNSAQMNKIASKLEKMGVEKIIFVGSTPRWTDFLPRIILRHLWNEMPERTFVGIDKNVINKNIIIKRNFNNSNKQVFIDLIALFCNEQGCLTRTGKEKNAELTSWDFGHLTQSASDFVASKVLVKEIIE